MTAIICISRPCRSPVACGGFGYCRQLNMADDYSPAADGARSYAEAHKAIRERLIRTHTIQPRQHDPEEQRWFKEGQPK